MTAVAGWKSTRVAALVHGAVGLVVHHLRLADKVGEVADFAVAGGEFGGIILRAGVAAGEVVLGPVVVDGLPVFLRHHAVNGFERGHGDGAGFSLEVVVGDFVELARGAPGVGTVRAHAGAVGGTGLIAAGGLELGQDLRSAASISGGGKPSLRAHHSMMEG